MFSKVPRFNYDKEEQGIVPSPECDKYKRDHNRTAEPFKRTSSLRFDSPMFGSTNADTSRSCCSRRSHPISSSASTSSYESSKSSIPNLTPSKPPTPRTTPERSETLMNLLASSTPQITQADMVKALREEVISLRAQVEMVRNSHKDEGFNSDLCSEASNSTAGKKTKKNVVKLLVDLMEEIVTRDSA